MEVAIERQRLRTRVLTTVIHEIGGIGKTTTNYNGDEILQRLLFYLILQFHKIQHREPSLPVDLVTCVFSNRTETLSEQIRKLKNGKLKVKVVVSI